MSNSVDRTFYSCYNMIANADFLSLLNNIFLKTIVYDCKRKSIKGEFSYEM